MLPFAEIGHLENRTLGKFEIAQLKGRATVAPARARGENGAMAVEPRSLRR